MEGAKGLLHFIMEITIFEPTGRDMKDEYPELAETEEFAGMNNRDIKFCWYVANRTSPIAKLVKKKRLEKAIEFSYGALVNKKQIENFKKGEFPDDVSIGMKKMALFNPSVRLRAKFYIEYGFDKIVELISISEKTMIALDADERKKYADLIFKMTAELSDMVKLQERGFGIKMKGKTKKATIQTNLGEVTDEL